MTTTKKLLVLLALTVGACRADNRSSILVLDRAAPSSATECKYAAGGESLPGPGVLDVSTQYTGFHEFNMWLYVNNELVDPADLSSSAATSSKAWRLDGARIRVNPSSYVSQYHPNPGLLPVSIPDTWIPASGQTIQVAGESVVRLRVIDSTVGDMLTTAVPPGGIGTVVVGITLQGETLDGQQLDAAEWYYPIRVCNGCLPVPTCPTDKPELVFSCGGPGQDAEPVCAAPATAAATP